MKQVNIITEGPSEKGFVDAVLKPYTKQRGVEFISTIVKTSRKGARYIEEVQLRLMY